VKLYPLAPLHEGGMHTDLPTIELSHPYPCQNIPVQVKRQKRYRRRPEDIIRAILIDSARFYNPNRRRHRREYTSTGTKLIYHNDGGPKQRKKMRSFLWDSDWRHGSESSDVEASVFEPSFHSVLSQSPEEEVVFKYCENSKNYALSPKTKAQAELCLLDSTQSPNMFPTEHDHVSFQSTQSPNMFPTDHDHVSFQSTQSPNMFPTDHDHVSFKSSQSSLQHNHGSTLPRFDEGESEPTNLTAESPKSLKSFWKFQMKSSNCDESREYSQDSLDSEVWKLSGGERHTHTSGSSSSSSYSSSSVPHTHQVRTQHEYCMSNLCI
jgi:hypothetical protein